MTVTFFFNYLNHHQVCIADEMYGILGEDFRFVATLPRKGQELKGGKDYSTRPYCLLAAEQPEYQAEAMHLALTSDVCVFGACSASYAVARAKQNPLGLSFEVAERWLKRGLLTFGSSVFRHWLLNYWLYFRRARFYKLCCSAFAAGDDVRLGCYTNRHFKWGYFTDVVANFKVEASQQDASTSEITPLMWCSRFLKLKHPELPVMMADQLRAKGLRFKLDFYGTGEEEERTKALVHKLQLQDVITFHGAMPNEQILQAMRKHAIFLFTSDRYEGWGAVANEAMANGCALVASDAIGSTGYLIKDGYNGFSFRSGDVGSLAEKVEWLLTHQAELMQMRQHACNSMQTLWSPQHAAKSLIQLIEDLKAGRASSIAEGPCSRA